MHTSHVGDYALFAVGSSQALKEEWAQMCTESCTALEEVSDHLILQLSLFVLSSLIFLLSVLILVLNLILPILHPLIDHHSNPYFHSPVICMLILSSTLSPATFHLV